MKRFLSHARLDRLVILTLVGLISACSSGGGTEPAPDDLIIGGLVVQANGVSIASVLGTEITGALQGQEGSTSPLLSVFFVDDKGVRFTPFDNEIMGVSIADASVATFAQEGTFTGRINNIMVGETTAIFRFIQGSTTIYTSPPIPVRVVGPI
jgi:hypothetical protein